MRPPEAQADAADVAVVEVVALGDLDFARAASLAARLSRHVSVPCRLLPGPSLHADMRLAPRPQHDAQALLTLVAGPGPGARPEAARLGLTDVDVGLPVFAFVFGLARTDGVQAALVSLARLDPTFAGLPPDEELTARRALGVMLHELGHLTGLAHCRAPSCVMRFAGTVAQADARGAAFCAACRARLPHWLRGPAGA